MSKIRALALLVAASLMAFAGAQAAPGPIRGVAQTGLGVAHSCSVSGPGLVQCWGSNEFNQLGVGDSSTGTVRALPVPVHGLPLGIRSLAVGYYHSCALTTTGTVKCWGRSSEGQLGDGTNEGGASPVDVQGLDGAVASISAGGLHTCALMVGGRVKCWGFNGSGQLGDGSSAQLRASAVEVVGLGAAADRIELGGEHSCARLVGGAVRCWGNNADGQLGDGSRVNRSQPTEVLGLPARVTDLAAGSRFTCALGELGGLFCWGPSYPLNAFETDVVTAQPYPGFGAGYRQIDAGVFHLCALRIDGRIKCLGDGSSGQLGVGPLTGPDQGEFVVNLPADVLAVAAGGDHGCAVSEVGGLLCWGRNNDGQLGIGVINERLVPTAVVGLDAGMNQVAAGSFHSCGLNDEGVVTCWGADNQSQLGNGRAPGGGSAVAMNVVGLNGDVRSLAVGFDHSCAIISAGRLQCWGANFAGQLGSGTALNSNVPVDVQGLDGATVQAVTLGEAHGCALLDDGEVRCWGNNAFGEVGDGTTVQRLSAVPVAGLGPGVRQISAGYNHTCAVTANAAAYCWGFNEQGQLGDGSHTQRNSPVAVLGLTAGVTKLAAGALHTCALDAAGAVSCWGSSVFGLLLGDGDENDRSIPGPVPTLRSGVTELVAGAYHSCVIVDSGMRCWGINSDGSIGDNSKQGRGRPTPVAGLSHGVSAIDAGFGGQTCAVVNGAAKCWGNNQFGQVGDGTLYGELEPRRVQYDDARRRIAAVASAQDATADSVTFDASGRYVLVASNAATLVPGDSNGKSDVFLIDRELNSVQRVSVDSNGAQLDDDARFPSMTSDARLVVFVARVSAVRNVLNDSAARRLKGDSDAVFLRNLLTGTTQIVGAADAESPAPQLSADGEAVVYTAQTTDGGEGTQGQENVYYVALTPLGNEVMLDAPICVSCRPSTKGGMPGAESADGGSGEAVVSADGSIVVYSTEATNSVAGDPSPCPDADSEVILANLLTGSTVRISPSDSSGGASCGQAGSSNPSIDYSGEVVAFESDQALVESDNNQSTDVYVWSAEDDSIDRISEASDGSDSNGASTDPVISGDGEQVAFVSSASNIDTSFADNNDVADVHTAAVDGEATRLSLTNTGAEADVASASPTLNYDGSQVAFVSTSSLLTGTAGTTAVLTQENPQASTRKSATWWIAAESGWGFTVFDQGSVLAPTWFTYDVDGEPTWFLPAGAFLQDDGSYSGELLRFTGTSVNAVDPPIATSFSPVGSTSLTFVGDEQLQFDYAVDGISQSKTLEKFAFGERSFVCTQSPDLSRATATNYTDLWSGSAADSAWGMTLFHIDELLVAIWYTYDDDGEAVFFVVSTTLQTDGTYSGDIYRQRDGIPFSEIDGDLPSAGNDDVGDASFRFIDGERAELTHSINGITRVRSMKRLLVGDQAQVCRSSTASGD